MSAKLSSNYDQFLARYLEIRNIASSGVPLEDLELKADHLSKDIDLEIFQSTSNKMKVVLKRLKINLQEVFGNSSDDDSLEDPMPKKPFSALPLSDGFISFCEDRDFFVTHKRFEISELSRKEKGAIEERFITLVRSFIVR